MFLVGRRLRPIEAGPMFSRRSAKSRRWHRKVLRQHFLASPSNYFNEAPIGSPLWR
jgi:hypothetical protein